MGTDPVGWHVVLVVGMSRGLGAALIAAAVVLSGCGADDGEDTTTSPPPEASVNPWDLPLEERPELFDPCAEIPVEAVEEALGGPVEPDELLHNHRPNELHTCGWKNDEALIGVVGTWKSQQEFLTDPEFGPMDTESNVYGRPGFRTSDRNDQFDSSCYQIFFTPEGAVVVNVVLLKTMGQYRGQNFTKSCDVLDDVLQPIMAFIPEEEF